jgi:small multidrug resistance family-3 protein
VTIARSLLLFALAALAEIGGAWLVWQGWREHRGLWWIAAGIIALGAYGFVATFQPDPHVSRVFRQTDGPSPGTQGAVQMCELWQTGEFEPAARCRIR